MINIEIAMKRLAKRESSAERNEGELTLVRTIMRTVQPTTVNLHPLYNLAVQLNLPLIQGAIAKRIHKIKPASRQEEWLVNAIFSHNKVRQA